MLSELAQSWLKAPKEPSIYAACYAQKARLWGPVITLTSDYPSDQPHLCYGVHNNIPNTLSYAHFIVWVLSDVKGSFILSDMLFLQTALSFLLLFFLFYFDKVLCRIYS